VKFGVGVPPKLKPPSYPGVLFGFLHSADFPPRIAPLGFMFDTLVILPPPVRLFSCQFFRYLPPPSFAMTPPPNSCPLYGPCKAEMQFFLSGLTAPSSNLPPLCQREVFSPRRPMFTWFFSLFQAALFFDASYVSRKKSYRSSLVKGARLQSIGNFRRSRASGSPPPELTMDTCALSSPLQTFLRRALLLVATTKCPPLLMQFRSSFKSSV